MSVLHDIAPLISDVQHAILLFCWWNYDFSHYL